jgi:hypothetical protein
MGDSEFGERYRSGKPSHSFFIYRHTDCWKTRTSPVKPNPDYPRLHDLARHATHVTETLDLSIDAARSVLHLHNMYAQQHRGQDRWTQQAFSQVTSGLRFAEHMLQNLKYRSNSNTDRLRNEINLVHPFHNKFWTAKTNNRQAFNTVAQYDSYVSVQIRKAAKADSSAMTTIAFLTLVFLPPTFISVDIFLILSILFNRS